MKKNPFTLQPEHIFFIVGGSIFLVIFGSLIYTFLFSAPDWTVELSKYGSICYELYQGEIAGPTDLENCR